LAIYKDQTFAERRDAAIAAKRALLDKFKQKPSADDPAVLAKQEERKAILEARAVREAEKARLKQERLAREAEERARQAAEAEAARIKVEEEAAEQARLKAIEEEDMLAAQLALEAAQKAKRDARYAARKSKTGRLPPSR
jgi:Family of unknown function (DUF6481)